MGEGGLGQLTAAWAQAFGSVWTAPVTEKLEMLSITLAVIALAVSIWDKIAVWVWDRYAPVKVSFDSSIIDEGRDLSFAVDGFEQAVRIRFTVRSRVDYRLEILPGLVMNRELLDATIQQLLDQIDGSIIASTDKPGPQLKAAIEARQARHLVLRAVVKGPVSGIMVPDVTFLVGQRRLPRRRSTPSRWSVEATWNGSIHHFRRVRTRDVWDQAGGLLLPGPQAGSART